MIEKLNVRLVGRRPLMLHNSQLADPSSAPSMALKPLTTKRGKTEEELLEIKRLEWLGGLHRDADGAISISEDMAVQCAIQGCMKTKNGKKAKAAIMGSLPYFPLAYDGPSDPIALYETGRFCDYRIVVNPSNKARVMRARPIFHEWSVEVEYLIESSILNPKQVVDALETAGREIGLGDFRPRFGRFVVEAVA